MPENKKKTRFLLLTYSNELHAGYFENESDLLDNYAEAFSNGITCEAYEVTPMDLELTARRKVKGS